jgi:hypothetical protein
LACFVAALGEMKRRQPILYESALAKAPAGEFVGCSEMSIEQQKQAIRSDLRMASTVESGIILLAVKNHRNYHID